MSLRNIPISFVLLLASPTSAQDPAGTWTGETSGAGGLAAVLRRVQAYAIACRRGQE